jgi:ferredoxin
MPPGSAATDLAHSRSARAVSRDDVELTVDIVACEAHGLCADLFPERVRLDDWGYPVIEAAALTPEELVHARRAARACPTLALRLRAATRT